MNRRSHAQAQLALPGVAPLCPHCGDRRTAIIPSADGAIPGDPDVVSGDEWACSGCGRTFWSLPSLGSRR